MTPAPQSTVAARNFLSADDNSIRIHTGDACVGENLNSQALQVPLRVDGKSFRIGGQNARAALIKKNASGCGVDMAEIAHQLDARHLSECAGHLNAYGSATDEREGKLATDFLRFRVFNRSHFLSSLERTQYFAANDVGIIERFEAGSELPPFVVPKVVVLDAGGEDEVVVRHVAPAQMNEALAGVDARYFIEKDLDVLLTTEDGTQRAGDFIRGEQARRDLVEHGAKEMIVPLIDQRDAHWSATQSAGCGEPSEAATDNDHAG